MIGQHPKASKHQTLNATQRVVMASCRGVRTGLDNEYE